MVNVIEMLEPTPRPLWAVVAQAGIKDVVTMLDGAEQQSRFALKLGETPTFPPLPPRGERPWDLGPLRALKEHYAGHGFNLVAVEDTAPMDAVRLGLPGRDEVIEQVIDQVEAMGALGIPVLCYNWMAFSSWARTDTAVPLRGGAVASGYEHAVNEQLPPLADGVTESQLWDALDYFLQAVVPVAERVGVTLGLHPDDPPLPVIRGVPRLARSVEAYRRVLSLVDSPANGVTLCQGNFTLMPDAQDLPAVIRELAGRIAFVHFRDVVGDAERFHEVFHDEGKTDMAACMRAYHEIGFTGPMRPDHVPTLVGEDNSTPGYADNGRLFAIGYIKGLREMAFGR